MARILIVDDEPDLVDYLVEEVELEGWLPGVAYDGVEAVLKVLDGNYDAVVMDFRMPRLDGPNALRLINRIAPSLPVIMFTGQAGAGEMAESVKLGAYTCLLKPVDVDQLIRVLKMSMSMST